MGNRWLISTHSSFPLLQDGSGQEMRGGAHPASSDSPVPAGMSCPSEEGLFTGCTRARPRFGRKPPKRDRSEPPGASPPPRRFHITREACILLPSASCYPRGTTAAALADYGDCSLVRGRPHAPSTLPRCVSVAAWPLSPASRQPVQARVH